MTRLESQIILSVKLWETVDIPELERRTARRDGGLAVAILGLIQRGRFAITPDFRYQRVRA